MVAHPRCIGDLVSAHLAADRSSILTTKGFAAPKDLVIGDELLVIDRAGSICRASVSAVVRLGAAPLRQLLTSVGEITAPYSAELGCTAGMVGAAALVEGTAHRLEAVSPVDLPELQRPEPLNGLTPLQTTVPLKNGAADVAQERIAAAQKSAKIDVRLLERDRWLVIDIAAIKARQRWSWAAELSLLMGLCAWEAQGDRLVTRTREDQAELRARLISAHVGAGKLFKLSWLPSYLPVECRLESTDEDWPAYVRIQRAIEASGGTWSITTDRDGALVIGSAIVRCALR